MIPQIGLSHVYAPPAMAAIERNSLRPLWARFLQESRVDVLPFDDTHVDIALEAFSRFGMGRHPAALDFGDCCSYATATVAREPLLCIGDDFPQTDLELVSLRDAR